MWAEDKREKQKEEVERGRDKDRQETKKRTFMCMSYKQF